jgi:Domain of unknown function (DUF4136)
MKSSLWVSTILFLALLFNDGCSPFLNVYAEEEPGINLYKYTTFSWLNNPASPQGNSGPVWQSQHTQDKIHTSVESQMQRYGFKRCDEKPDLMLHYHVVVKNEVLFVRDQWCDEESWNKLGHCNRVRPVNYQEGMLIIDLIDSKTGNQVWRGAAVAVRENLSDAQADARIEEAVRLIFNKFPQKPIGRFAG